MSFRILKLLHDSLIINSTSYINSTTLTKKINMTTYFENLTVELPEFKHLIDDIAIDI